MESIGLSSDISDTNITISQKTGKNISIKRATLPKVHLYIDNNHNFYVFYKEHKSFFDKWFADLEQDLDVDVWIDGRRVSLSDIDLSDMDRTDRSYRSDMSKIYYSINQIWWVSVVVWDMLDVDIDIFKNIDDVYILTWDIKMIWLDYNTIYVR